MNSSNPPQHDHPPDNWMLDGIGPTAPDCNGDHYWNTGVTDQTLHFGPLSNLDANATGPMEVDLEQGLDFLHPPLGYSNTNEETTIAPGDQYAVPGNSYAVDSGVVHTPRLRDVKSSGGPRKRATRLEWEQYKPFIEEHYIRLDWSLADTAKALKEKGFPASERKCKEKLKSWGLTKNLEPQHAAFIRKTALRRQRVGKRKSEFIVRGQPVPAEKVDRHCQGHTYSELPPTEDAPSGIECRTPFNTHDTRPPATPADLVATTTMALEWNGYSVEDLRKLLDESFHVAHGPQRDSFLQALPNIKTGIDGLEALMGSTHHLTLTAIDTFANLAVEHKQMDEAETRLRKSVTDHEGRFGKCNEKTYQSLARLGLFYHAFDHSGEAEKLLFFAMDGINRLEDFDEESKFISTIVHFDMLYEILEQQANFSEAENILCRRIAQTESLGVAHAPTVLTLKHNLTHLYQNREWKSNGIARPPPWSKLLQVLESLVDNASSTETGRSVHNPAGPRDICPWLMLMDFHLGRGDQAKLTDHCDRTEGFIKTLMHVESSERENLHELKDKLVRAFSVLGQKQRAEEWLMNQQSEIDDSDALGPSSRESFEAKLQHALFFVGLDEQKTAEPLLLEAQDKAQRLFKEDHTIHERLAHCLATNQWKMSCENCGQHSEGFTRGDLMCEGKFIDGKFIIAQGSLSKEDNSSEEDEEEQEEEEEVQSAMN